MFHTNHRIAERTDGEFEREQVGDYLMTIYSNLEKDADEYGKLEPKTVSTIFPPPG